MMAFVFTALGIIQLPLFNLLQGLYTVAKLTRLRRSTRSSSRRLQEERSQRDRSAAAARATGWGRSAAVASARFFPTELI